MNDLRVLRERQAAADAALDSALGDQAPHASAAVLAKTTTEGTYPTSAGSFFACVPQDVDGDEVEGSAASYVASSTTVFWVWNAGSTVPPDGTTVVAHAVGGRWVMRYDS